MKTPARCLIAFASLLPMAAPGARAVAADSKNLQTKAAPCTECLRIRLGVRYVARGPAPNTVDNCFSVIRLPNGRFRGFTATASCYAIADLGPGKWMKFFQGRWDQPGLGGDATGLGNWQGNNAQEHWHFASNGADCERLGTMERLLGYAVSQ